MSLGGTNIFLPRRPQTGSSGRVRVIYQVRCGAFVSRRYCLFKRGHLARDRCVTSHVTGKLRGLVARKSLTTSLLLCWVNAGAGCLTHSCSLHGGARALTPTPPSVTSASRVRLFPRYVRRVFLPFFFFFFVPAGCFQHWSHSVPTSSEQSSAAAAARLRCHVYQPMDGGGFHLEVDISEAPHHCKLFKTLRRGLGAPTSPGE